MIGGVDAGAPISYLVLAEGTAVHAADGEPIGTVGEVVAAPEQDIFDGLVLATSDGERFVAADRVTAIHERRVDVSLSSAQADSLPRPER